MLRLALLARVRCGDEVGTNPSGDIVSTAYVRLVVPRFKLPGPRPDQWRVGHRRSARIVLDACQISWRERHVAKTSPLRSFGKLHGNQRSRLFGLNARAAVFFRRRAVERTIFVAS